MAGLLQKGMNYGREKDKEMEKKTPERMVRLREGDVFYVYDKRINKCIRENCEGIVKYGLTLKVIMPNGEPLNTYECNKCHMRDKKRATDAVKHAAKEKRKPFGRKRKYKTKQRYPKKNSNL